MSTATHKKCGLTTPQNNGFQVFLHILGVLKDIPLFLGYPSDKYIIRILFLTISVNKIHQKVKFSAFLAKYQLKRKCERNEIGFSSKTRVF